MVNLSGGLLLMMQAQMQFKDKWFACVSLGEQTFRTVTSVQLSTTAPMSYTVANLRNASSVIGRER